MHIQLRQQHANVRANIVYKARKTVYENYHLDQYESSEERRNRVLYLLTDDRFTCDSKKYEVFSDAQPVLDVFLTVLNVRSQWVGVSSMMPYQN